jgi:hypothetical protein
MVGEGVLLECLNHPDVELVMVINRKPGGVSHPKLREIVHSDFFNLASAGTDVATPRCRSLRARGGRQIE